MQRPVLSLLAVLCFAHAARGGPPLDPSLDRPLDRPLDPPVAESAPEAAGAGYCDYVEGIADAESALLLWPELFGATGLVNGGTVLTGDANFGIPTTLRLTAGMRYDFVGLYRGLVLKDRAAAECRRFRAESLVKLSAAAAREAGRREGLSARLAFLEDALPRAEDVLERRREALARGQATVEEVYATQLRVDALKADLSAGRQKLAALRETGEMPTLAALAEATDEAERAAGLKEAHAARLREASAWSVGLRGGYDQTFAPGLSQIPIFGLLQVSYNLGGLWQGAAHERALAGAARERSAEVGSLASDVRALAEELRGAFSAERKRLAEVALLERDAEHRWQDMKQNVGPRAAEHADYLWFEVTRLRAERVYLEDRLAVLATVLGEKPPPTRAERAVLGQAEHGPASGARAPALAVARALALPSSFAVTTGELSPLADGAFRVTTSKLRAVQKQGRARSVALRFRYLGPTKEREALGSGQTRRQLGFKLRAQDGCNLVYAMWRLEPREGVIVQTKRNPGAQRHADCENGGYERVPPERSAVPPVITPGSDHVLEARLDGEKLTVLADGELVWQGQLPTAAFEVDGPAGLRTDNVELEGRFEAGG